MERQKDDRQWLEAVRGGSDEACRELVQRYGGMVFTVIARMVPQREDAEELYQDVWVKAFGNIRLYDSQRSSLATWLEHIAYTSAVSHLRKRHHYVCYLDEQLEKLDVGEAEDEMMQSEEDAIIDRLLEAVHLLPVEEQSLISMFYYDELSLKEIAFVTDSLPSTVASRLCRIRNKLYKLINKEGKR